MAISRKRSSSQRRPKACRHMFIYRLRPTAGCSSPTKCKHFVGFLGLRTSELFSGNINESRYTFYLRAFSNERVYNAVCTRFTSAGFRRTTAQRLVGIYSYTAYALQRAAPLQQNASILLGFYKYCHCKFFPHNDK